METKTTTIKAKRRLPQGPFCCYALEHTHSRKSYTGQTNNFERRLRQHNGSLKGGARYTSSMNSKGTWQPLFRVCGFQTLRAVLQFEWAMKKRKVPMRFQPHRKQWTRGPYGRVRQLEYLLSLGRLNPEAHSTFSDNGIFVQLCIPLERYVTMAGLTMEEFHELRRRQGVPFKS